LFRVHIVTCKLKDEVEGVEGGSFRVQPGGTDLY
jgi:hypothetical protein